jgi:hypothetical protein
VCARRRATSPLGPLTRATIPSGFGYNAGLKILREGAADAYVTDLLNLDIVTAQQLAPSQLEQFTN